MNILEANDGLSVITKLSRTTISVRHITKGGERVKRVDKRSFRRGYYETRHGNKGTSVHGPKGE